LALSVVLVLALAWLVGVVLPAVAEEAVDALAVMVFGLGSRPLATGVEADDILPFALSPTSFSLF
jgi:hypothetical protein